jgi:hypothetical protein
MRDEGLAKIVALADVTNTGVKESMNRPRISLKRIAIMFVCFSVALLGLFLYALPGHKAPHEQDLIENFYSHRAAYENLRQMLQENKQLLRVANWGVETTDPVGIHHPPEGGFPLNRYNDYVALLAQTGSKEASRSRGEGPGQVCITMWASGWAADTRRAGVCWAEQEPSSEVTDLESYFQGRGKPRLVFRHIVDKWYLFADR